MRATSDFILENIEPILQEWEDFARSLSPGDDMSDLALRDDAESILRSVVLDMQTPQSVAEQQSKSKGQGGAGGEVSERLDDMSARHGTSRFVSGSNIDEVVSEYRALRASVLRLWAESSQAPQSNPDVEDRMRFQEAIDQSLAHVVMSYSRRVDQSRKIFLAILAHDLRSPLAAIKIMAQVIKGRYRDDPQSAEELGSIEESADMCAALIQDLMDFASPALGGKLSIKASLVDLRGLALGVLDEMRASHAGGDVTFNCRGDVKCMCDGPRMRQVLSNLLGNALTYGARGEDVELSMSSDRNEVVFSVRNQGPPIPPELLPRVFNPLVRDPSDDASNRRRAGGLGLGLFIAREIVTAHDGVIEVASTAETGTVFSVRIPRPFASMQHDDEPTRTEQPVSEQR